MNENDCTEQWNVLRAVMGAPDYREGSLATKCSEFCELRPGDRVLFMRKYAGLGDCLIQSCLLNDFKRQAPSSVRVTYAVPEVFQCLFDGATNPDEVIPYHRVRSHRADPAVAKYVLDNFDWIEDLSVPEVYWESIFQRHGRDASGMRRLNRLEMWAWWLGMEIDKADTCIRPFDDEEISHTCSRFGLSAGDYVALSMRTLHDAKDYPYYEELADRLRDEVGLVPVFVHTSPMKSRYKTFYGQNVREMGAFIAGAALTVCCDTAAMHWAGILNRPAVAMFTSNDAATYLRYYKTVRGLQACETPCILHEWAKCSNRMEAALGHDGKSCYANCNQQVMDLVGDILEGDGDAVMPWLG